MRTWLAVAMLSTPGAAWACAVCFDATEENRQAFLDTTIFMTGLPLLLVGVGVFWVYRRYQEVAA